MNTLLTSRRHTLIGGSAWIQALRAEIETAARTDAKVLLTGETGVGKEVVAHAIHERSRRRANPLVTVNCAGVPDTLLESEFFGHRRGSFTGAVRDSPGLLRQAHTGTVFLDEIGEMSLRLQALLLRFLETGEVQSVGDGGDRAFSDVRVIAATNRNLLASVAKGEFREDLYYRVNVLHVHIPPLRERRADIPLLVDHYLQVFASQHRCPIPVVTPGAMQRLVEYAWPGNIRELRNVVERLVVRATDTTIDESALPPDIAGTALRVKESSTSAAERPHLREILEAILVRKESFWTTAYQQFMMRDITRDDLRDIVHAGLERTQGNYRSMVSLFNMSPEDYKRFMGFLKHHDCHVPFQRFRNARIEGWPATRSSTASDSFRKAR